jgi:hypothetical protein
MPHLQAETTEPTGYLSTAAKRHCITRPPAVPKASRPVAQEPAATESAPATQREPQTTLQCRGRVYEEADVEVLLDESFLGVEDQPLPVVGSDVAALTAHLRHLPRLIATTVARSPYGVSDGRGARCARMGEPAVAPGEGGSPCCCPVMEARCTRQRVCGICGLTSQMGPPG